MARVFQCWTLIHSPRYPARVTNMAATAALLVCLVCFGTACGEAQVSPPSGHTIEDGLMVNGSFDCARNLVFASNQLTYSAADIQAMLDYLSGFTTSGPPSGSPPSFLTWEPGALVDAGHSTMFLRTIDPCKAKLNVTNTSDHDITITGGGVKLVRDSMANTTRYATVDVCDLQEQGTISGNADLTWCNNGAGQSCSFGLGVPLGGGNVGADYTSTFTNEGCTTIDLPAHQNVDMSMLFTSQQALIYEVAPELLTTDGSGSHTVVLSDWTNTLVFATPDQMPCYQLQQDTFSLESGAEACS